jgi:DNA invertase Pin-like site-specific DNA recombinase
MPGVIKPEHLMKIIFIYVRQSSLNQVRHHLESQHLQYRLRQRALELGWPEAKIVLCDDDLGITATGVKKRPGFEELLSQLRDGHVGAILVLTASRIARNGREWHQVLEGCSVTNTLIIDSDGIYDPNLANDRLWLGMKSSFSEYEVNQLRALAQAAIRNKAARGQLFHNLPPGLIRTADDRLELDPNQRVQNAIRTLFRQLEELGSIRRVYQWCHRHDFEMPLREYKHGVGMVWRVPTYSALNRLFTNPLYAGIYMYPRTTTRTRIVEGRLVKTHGHRVTADDNPVLIRNLFESYISAEQFERNQKLLADNTQRRNPMALGAAREGSSLLAGLLYCSHCSRKLRVHYNHGESVAYYFCPRNQKTPAAKSCLRLRGQALEALISEQLLAAVKPVAIEAAVVAEEKLAQARQEQTAALHLKLQQAEYEAQRLERQFNATEPENHLVYHTLTSRWQKALEKVDDIKSQYEQALTQHQLLTEPERARLLELASDLSQVWQHPSTRNQTKTRLVRLLVKAVWVKALDAGKIQATIHWHGGVHTVFEFRGGRVARATAVKEQQQLVTLIQQLAMRCDDQQIARTLNRARLSDAKDRSWTAAGIAALRKKNQIPVFSPQDYAERGLLNLEQAAAKLEVSLASVLRLIRLGVIKAHQLMKYAPWEIETTELDKPMVRAAAAALKKRQDIPFHENQQALNL